MFRLCDTNMLTITIGRSNHADIYTMLVSKKEKQK